MPQGTGSGTQPGSVPSTSPVCALLLAAGRNSTRIQEELNISAGTTNTHCHHVFQKLAVHSQQEVIDLFVSADLDEIQKELKARQER